MKKFVIGHINLFDNRLTLELIEAESEHQARWQHSELQKLPDWSECNADTAHMDAEEFQEWCFGSDMLVSSLEIPS
jgi:hypothetical protein